MLCPNCSSELVEIEFGDDQEGYICHECGKVFKAEERID